MNKLRKHSVFGVAILLIVGLTGCDLNSDNSEINLSEQYGYVDPFIGSNGLGNVFLGAVVPEGMIQPSPDGVNDDGTPGAYHANTQKTSGFSLTHISGAGMGDLNDISFLPYTDDNKQFPLVDKNKEVAVPGYYKTYLLDNNISVELTATKRVALKDIFMSVKEFGK